MILVREIETASDILKIRWVIYNANMPSPIAEKKVPDYFRHPLIIVTAVAGW
jgi:hypothetical protein